MEAKRAARRPGCWSRRGCSAASARAPAAWRARCGPCGRLGAEQVRAMSFVPHPGHPAFAFSQFRRRNCTRHLDTGRELAGHRRAAAGPARPAHPRLPGRGRPGRAGARLAAGANVVTSLVPPGAGPGRRGPERAGHRGGAAHGGRGGPGARALRPAPGRAGRSTGAGWTPADKARRVLAGDGTASAGGGP